MIEPSQISATIALSIIASKRRSIHNHIISKLYEVHLKDFESSSPEALPDSAETGRNKSCKSSLHCRTDDILQSCLTGQECASPRTDFCVFVLPRRTDFRRSASIEITLFRSLQEIPSCIETLLFPSFVSCTVVTAITFFYLLRRTEGWSKRFVRLPQSDSLIFLFYYYLIHVPYPSLISFFHGRFLFFFLLFLSFCKRNYAECTDTQITFTSSEVWMVSFVRINNNDDDNRDKCTCYCNRSARFS